MQALLDDLEPQFLARDFNIFPFYSTVEIRKEWNPDLLFMQLSVEELIAFDRNVWNAKRRSSVPVNIKESWEGILTLTAEEWEHALEYNKIL